MKPRQLELLKYHADLATFATSEQNPVFVILDLDDADAFDIACQIEPNCADRRQAIRKSNAIPAYTLAMSVESANRLVANGWPNLKRIKNPQAGFVPVLLFSCGTCLSALLPKG